MLSHRMVSWPNLPTPHSNQVETFCLFLGRFASRRMQLPLKRDMPKSPFGTNEQPPHQAIGRHPSLRDRSPFRFRTAIHRPRHARAALRRLVAATSGEER